MENIKVRFVGFGDDDARTYAVTFVNTSTWNKGSIDLPYGHVETCDPEKDHISPEMKDLLTPIDKWRDPKPAMFVFRWISFLPVAFIAAVVGAVFVKYANEGAVLVGVVVNYLFGAIYVCLGGYIVPSYKKPVSMVLAGVLIMGCGILLFPAFQRGDYWAAIELLATIGGALGGYYYLSNEFTKL